MEFFEQPLVESWAELTARPKINFSEIEPRVKEIINNVKSKGDQALRQYSLEFDQVEIENLVKLIDKPQISKSLADSIQVAKDNIEKFHRAQKRSEEKIETTKGVTCWRKYTPIEKVGLYIPGGTAPLFSSLLMLAIPAKIAGCKEIRVCTPPNHSGDLDPVLQYVASLLDIDEVYLVGGAQVIAAMAYGTESITKIDKIFGPGNQYVDCAKRLVAASADVAIDLPAGPTELLVIADQKANPKHIAADLLSQTEHGTDSQVILISNHKDLFSEVEKEINKQLESLERKEIAIKALENSKMIYFDNINQAIQFSNFYAPEHLILALADVNNYIADIENAGSVFLGYLTPESFGDYASGTNHTLPTASAARSYGGVSLESFQKAITFQEANQQGLESLGSVVMEMAEAEGLTGHKKAVEVRLEDIT